jgi:hypothetical protein
MAEFNFTPKDIEVLQEAATKAQKAAAEKAQEVIQESKLEFSISTEIKALFAPKADSELVGGNECFACVSCLFMFAVIALAMSK